MSVCHYCGEGGHNPAFCPQSDHDRKLVKEGCEMASLRINVGQEFNADSAATSLRMCKRQPCLCTGSR